MSTRPRPSARGIVDALGRETRHALRRLVRDWRFTTAAVLLLGLGIGANTAIFSLVNATLLRGQAVHAPDRLVDIYAAHGNQVGASLPSALHAAIESGRLQRGDHALLLGTGAGISLGGMVLCY